MDGALGYTIEMNVLSRLLNVRPTYQFDGLQYVLVAMLLPSSDNREVTYFAA